MSTVNDTAGRIAVVGMSARFPGAPTVADFWRNLRAGVESVRHFTREELAEAGVGAAELAHPDYVRAAALLDDVEGFDAAFFGYAPREAEQMDPQQRVLLEVAAAALDDAGHARVPDGTRVGVFVGASMSHYAFNLYSHGGLTDPMGSLRAFFGNAESHLATRISYKLDLKGPSMFVQTACSTSLVAVHLACQSLLGHECDVALAGGSSITVPHPAGYLSREGGVLSPDGHCRGFDAEARGTLIGNGAGAVVLRRLEDALADGDTIHAVILGSAVNNDGSGKIGYTAPSQEGQAAVIAEALAVAGVEPDTIGYVEAHGTGTQLGDPIEVAALTQAFRAGTDARGYCAIGSVKSNFGHLLAAAGVAGIIKAVLALRNREIPPHLHFTRPNPRIDFAASPFFVADALRPWTRNGHPRRAGVSSFGIGGTNAHIVLEEAPAPRPAAPARPWQLLPLSARTPTALDTLSEGMAEHLRAAGTPLADAAFTLQVGRRAGALRRVVVARGAEEAAEALSLRDPARVSDGEVPAHGARPVFIFPGQGAQAVGMGAELYREEPLFRRWFDRCARLLQPELGMDLREVVLDGRGGDEALTQTAVAQPALFAVEFALARWWMRHGVVPRAMAGHSLGEYVAATLAGVFPLRDALRVVAARGRLMQACEPGAMLTLPVGEAEARALLPDGVELAAVNGETSCVACGPAEAISALEAELSARGVRCTRLRVSHAFHSASMEPAARALEALLREVPLRAPSIPFLSGVTGTWITPAEATDPAYWARQLRQTVRFGDCLRALVDEEGVVLIEAGPGRTLSALASRLRRNPPPVASLTEAGKEEQRQLLAALGRAWTQGVEVAWERLHRPGERRRVPLPTTPFEHKRFWVEARRAEDAPPSAAAAAESAGNGTGRKEDVGDWFYLPSWRRSLAPAPSAAGPEVWLVFADRGGVGEAVRDRLLAGGDRVVLVDAADDGGDEPGWPAGDRAAVRPGHASDYDALLARLAESGWRPRRVLHLWSLDDDPDAGEGAYDSLLRLAQALGRRGETEPMALGVVTGSLHRLSGEPRLRPGGALAGALCRVIPQEFAWLACRHVDIVPEEWTPDVAAALVAEVRAAGEARSAGEERVVALRSGGRWVQRYEPQPLPPAAPETAVRAGGVYLVTGGLGGIGRVIAGALARDAGARLVLTGRAALPPREEWDAWLAGHGDDDAVAGRIRAVREIEAAGGEVMLATADAADREAMEAVVRQARDRFGRIDGVVHAAGVAGGAMLQRQTPEGAHRVLASKTEGTRILHDLLRDDPPDFVLLCSSLASVRGGFGQGDYAAANAYLDAFAWAWDNRRTRVVSVNWGAWAEVGMAVEAVRKRGFLPCPFWLRAAEQARDAGGHPFLGRAIERGGGERAVRSDLRVADQWVLSEHTVGGRATWPGTAYLELVRAAWHALGGDAAVELADVTFLAPLQVGSAETRAAFTLFEGEGDGAAFRVASGPGGAEEPEQLQEHARGRVSRLAGAASRIDLPAILGRLSPVPLDGGSGNGNGNGNGGERLVGLGGRWHALEALHVADGEGVAVVALPSGAEGDLCDLVVHPAMLDVALGAAKRVAGAEGDHLPLSYGRVRIYGALPARVFCHLRVRPGTGEGRVRRFDATLADGDGRVLLEVEDYALRRLDDAGAQLAPALAAERGSGEADALIAGAIRNDEGVDAFYRALAAGAPQLVVSALPLDAVLKKWAFEDGSVTDRLGGVRLPRRALARPDAAGQAAAPEGEAEARVAALWTELLGIDPIGRSDDFFSLGGDSLLGIQLHSRIKEAFRIDIPLATVFENPTVADLARVVEAQLLASIGEEELLRRIEALELAEQAPQTVGG
jgi:phthiocerol/phenolphthiocerol synthesis type-I polyketide synthase E